MVLLGVQEVEVSLMMMPGSGEAVIDGEGAE